MLIHLFTTKPIAAFAQTNAFKRSLSAFDVVLLGIGVIIGAGIFVLTGQGAATLAGPAIAVSFVIAALVASLAGLCYAEMAALMPSAGSAYSYTYATLGEWAAFLVGWGLVFEYLIGAATVSVGASGYLQALLHKLLGWHLPSAWCQAPLHLGETAQASGLINAPAALFALAVGAVLLVGIKDSARFNSFIVTIKLLVIVVFVAIGAFFVNTQHWQPFLPANTGVFGHFGVSGLLQGANLVFFSFVGFDALSTLAQETKKPQRDLPIGMLLSLLICTVFYVAVSLVLTGIVPYRELAVAHPIAVAMARLHLPWLEVFVDAGALCGMFSAALVLLLGQTRIFFAMAEDGLFFRFALAIHPRFKTPFLISLLTTLLAAMLSALLPIQILGQMSSVGTLWAFLMVSLATMVMRIRKPDLPRPFKVPFGSYCIPLISATSTALLMGMASTMALVRLVVWLTLGTLFYLLYGYKHAHLRAHQTMR